MDLTTSMATKNPCYKAGKSIQVKGIVLEGVGCPQPSAKVFAHNRNREDCEGKCAHAFIDANDGSIIQLLPWSHRGWHCGKHPRTKVNANNTHIGIQLCEPSQIRYKIKHEIELAGDKERALAAAERVYNSAVELCAFLCTKFELNPMTSVLSRKEAYTAAICSMNSSPEFVWEAIGAEYTMDKLRADVRDTMQNIEVEVADIIQKTGLQNPEPIESPLVVTEVTEVPESSNSATVIEVELTEVEPKLEQEIVEEEKPKLQMVRITVNTLRIRSSPGIGNNTTGQFTGKGIFAITEIQNGSGSKLGWGKLENGAGWICLDYVEML